MFAVPESRGGVEHGWADGALAVCRGCGVRQDCLQEALTDARVPTMVMGGYVPADLVLLRRMLALSNDGYQRVRTEARSDRRAFRGWMAGT